MLCTAQDIKDRVGETGTEFDAVIEQIALGFTARADAFCQRPLLATAAAVTEYQTGISHLLHLERYPVIAITSVKESWTHDFLNDVTVLTAGTDYRQASAGRRGVLQRLYGVWPCAFESVQVIYRGGYQAAGADPVDGETPLPADLREAAILQCAFLFKRRDDLGLSGVSFQGGSFSKFEQVKLLPEVEAILNSYRRVTL